MDSVGHFCVDINECAEKDFCDSGATCINTNGGFRCVCPEGYRSEGRACKREYKMGLALVYRL